MSQITEPRQLFLHELGDVLGAEQAIEKALTQVQGEVQDDQLKKRLGQHVDETREQIQNLEKVFEQLGEPPKAERCPSVEGMRAEHQETAGMVGDQLKDAVAVASQTKIEHYEIAAYQSLILQATTLGEKEAADLLNRNLKQEKDMLADVEKEGRRVLTEAAQGA